MDGWMVCISISMKEGKREEKKRGGLDWVVGRYGTYCRYEEEKVEEEGLPDR